MVIFISVSSSLVISVVSSIGYIGCRQWMQNGSILCGGMWLLIGGNIGISDLNQWNILFFIKRSRL